MKFFCLISPINGIYDNTANLTLKTLKKVSKERKTNKIINKLLI